MADVQELNVNNTTYDIKAKSVVDTNSGSVKMWTGTRQQYDAIVSKDANTLYNITDDTDVTLTLLDALYPVGSIYIGTMANCPLATLGVGTWQLVATDRVLQGATDGSVVGNTVEAGLPNINGDIVARGNSGNEVFASASGAMSVGGTSASWGIGTSNGISGTAYGTVTFNASLSNPIYGNSNTVQPPAYLVNIWERTA